MQNDCIRVAKYAEFEYVVEHSQKVLSLHPSWGFKKHIIKCILHLVKLASAARTSTGGSK